MSAVYKRRIPHEKDLWKFIHKNLPAFKSQHPELPAYVYKTFDAFLDCGNLRKGFMRTRCPTCKEERITGFSCKKRGICISCGTKRMNEAADYFVANILPQAHYRQIVFTLPHPLRYWVAANSKLLSKVNQYLSTAIHKNLEARARAMGMKRP